MDDKENLFYHEPIMLKECLDYLNVLPDKIYFDGTLGGGGHSNGILLRGGRLIATDKDDEALSYARNRFSKNENFTGRFTLVKDDFKNVKNVLKNNGIDFIDGAILDLGISSHQIDDPSRGFSYMRDGALDMRMDSLNGITAADIVNSYPEDELANIIYEYGEERFSRKIAFKICQQRKIKPIKTTLELSNIICSSVPRSDKGGHPAKRTFQALRIAVNGELDGLKTALTDLVGVLNIGARLLIITFHSLEDRIVKQTLKAMSQGCICDKSFPVCVCGHKAEIKLVENKGIKASTEEVNLNSRSKSATLRIAEKM